MIVVGCGKRKLAVKAPARDLYTGSLFVAARKYAEASGQGWLILSAEYGIVLPAAELAPYERKLSLKGAELQSWAVSAATACAQHCKPGEHVEVLAGHPYAWPFRNELHWMDVPSSEPLEGMGLGQRLRWLSQSLARVVGERQRVDAEAARRCALCENPYDYQRTHVEGVYAGLCEPHYGLLPVGARAHYARECRP